MVASTHSLLGPSEILRLCLAPGSTRTQLQQGVAGLRALAQQEHALELRLAMVLTWLKHQDPADLGYPSFGALCHEHVDWRRSWTYALVRLVESPLELVKRAACEGLIPLRLAVHAPGRLGVADQEAWLAAAVFEQVERREPRALETFEGADAIVVREARSLSRLLLGRGASTREVDDFILTAWRRRTPAEELLQAAGTPPLAPPVPAPLDWRGLEPWNEPASTQEAVARVAAIQAMLRGRRIVLAKAWAVISHEKIWACAGFVSAEAFAKEVLGVSLRTAQRMAKAGWALEWYPELEEAVASGLPFGVAHELAPILDPRTVVDWIAVAERVGRRELGLAVEEAKQIRPAQVCARYRRAIEAADTWWRDTTRAGQLAVALPHPEPEHIPAPLRAPSELPDAGRWLLQQVQIPPRRGFAAVKTRDHERCQNPECGRRSLCNQAHHIEFRSRGGSDDPENGITGCRPCHLRCLHTGRITVERVRVAGAEALLWGYPNRFVLQFREALDAV